MSPSPAFAPGTLRLPVLLGLALLAWSGSVVRGGFALDDRELIAAPVIQGSLPMATAFDQAYFHHLGNAGHYRPIATLSLRVDRWLWGTKAAGFHATNLALHLATLTLAWLLLRRLGAAGRGAMAGLLVLALHPVLADSIAWISGRTALLAGLFGVTALLAPAVVLHRMGPARGPASPRLLIMVAWIAVALCLALLSREDAVAFLPAVLLLCLVRQGRGAAIPWSPFLAGLFGAALALLAVAGLRIHALGTALPHATAAALGELPLLERLPYGGRALLEGLRLMVLPLAGPPTYRAVDGFVPAGLSTGQLLTGCLGWLPWLALVALGMHSLLARRSGPESADGANPVLLRGGAALCVALALGPALQFIPSGEVFAPRYLHIPMVLGVPILAALVPRPGFPRLLLICLALACCWVRAGVYSSRGAYAESVLASVPDDPAAWNNLGLHLSETGDQDGAMAAWRKAVSVDVHYSRAWNHLGAAAMAKGDLELAEAQLRKAVLEGPSNPAAACNLGNLLLRQGKPSRAATVYAQATELTPGFAPAWRGLGNARLQSGNFREARPALERALALAPGDALTLRLMERLP